MTEVKQAACLMPWVSIWCKPTGEVYPCCAAAIDGPSQLGHLGEQTLKSVFNGQRMKELRRTFMEGRLDEAVCRKCVLREKVQGESLRTMIDKDYGHLAAELLGRTQEDGTFEDFKLLFVDFVWSNKCNFKCVHCTPVVSSAIAQVPEFRRFYDYPHENIEQLSTINAGLMDEFLQNIDAIKTIHFNGGEPFVIEEHFEILDHLIKIGRTDAHLWFHTNGSNLGTPKYNIIEYLKHFKNVRVSFSQDGVGLRGQYVRHGYRDDKFLSCLKAVKEVVGQVNFGVSAHALSVGHLTDIIDWHYERGTISPNGKEISVNIISDPSFMGYAAVDEETRHIAADKLEKWLPARKGVLTKLLYRRLDDIMNGLREPKPENGKDWQRMKDYLDIKKSVLKQDARAVFPEYQRFFDLVGYS